MTTNPHPDTEMSEIAVAVFSWGGVSNLFAAARDNRIDALVARERINSFSRTLLSFCLPSKGH